MSYCIGQTEVQYHVLHRLVTIAPTNPIQAGATLDAALKVMGDRETEFLGHRFTLVAMQQKLGFSKSHYYRYRQVLR